MQRGSATVLATAMLTHADALSAPWRCIGSTAQPGVFGGRSTRQSRSRATTGPRTHCLRRRNSISSDELLRHRLATLAELRLQDDQGNGRWVLRVSKSKLAEMLGLSRLLMNRMLHALEAEATIELGPRRVVVPDVARLRLSAKAAAERRPSHV